MRRQLFFPSLALLVSVEAASAQSVNQTSVVNYFLMAVGGSSSSVGVTQSGAANSVYAVQTANQSNSIIVNQQGISDVVTLEQQSQNGLNSAYVNQRSGYNKAEITQIGQTNIAGIAQNSSIGRPPSGPSLVLGGGPAPSNGPVFQSLQMADGGYLSLFETEGMSLATYTTGGMTVMSSFGRQH
jgi:hypothetical protein